MQTSEKSMSTVTCTDGVKLAVYQWGDANDPVPILLNHGFATSTERNWERPGVVQALVASGRRVVAFDARGHGASDTPLEPERYARSRLAQDVIEVTDALGLTRCDVAGYSMGGFVTVISAARDARTRRLAICGCCQQLFADHSRDPGMRSVPAAIRSDDPSSIEHRVARAFRAVADASGGNRLALAACFEGMTGPHWEQSVEAVSKLRLPTLVIGGRDDPLMVGIERLTGPIAGAELAWVNGDHLSAVSDPAFAKELTRFFNAD